MRKESKKKLCERKQQLELSPLYNLQKPDWIKEQVIIPL